MPRAAPSRSSENFHNASTTETTNERAATPLPAPDAPLETEPSTRPFMKPHRLFPCLLLGAACALLPLASAHAEEANTIKFSDPAKPGTLKLQIGRGDVRIKGADVPEITVKTDAKPVNKPRKDGLRVLTASAGFSLTEKNNVVTLDTLADGWHGGGADFTITVPRSTSIVLNAAWGGSDIHCTDIAGDIEIESMHGEVNLDGISGGALVSTMNGEIRANIAKLNEKKPLSFSSMNGEVVIRVPADSKANIRLRTQNGQILTDFDEGALVSKIENAPRAAGKAVTFRGRGKVLPPEAEQAIQEAARATAEGMRVAQQALREAGEAMREGAAEAARAVDAARVAPAAPDAPATPQAAAAPRPPKIPTMITMSGGKLVTGTLNGGGPEITVATMNGDVTLRKLESK
jgi:hypothetical protein